MLSLRRSPPLPDALRGLCVLPVVTLLTLSACTPTNAANRDGDPSSNGLATVAVDGAVTFQIIPQFDRLHSDALPGQLDVLVRLEGSEDALTARPDLDLAIVLDRSAAAAGIAKAYGIPVDELVAINPACVDPAPFAAFGLVESSRPSGIRLPDRVLASDPAVSGATLVDISEFEQADGGLTCLSVFL